MYLFSCEIDLRKKYINNTKKYSHVIDIDILPRVTIFKEDVHLVGPHFYLSISKLLYITTSVDKIKLVPFYHDTHDPKLEKNICHYT